MKLHHAIPTALAALSPLALAGPITDATDLMEADPFASARRPITNPTLFDLALPTTNIHPIFMHHQLPGTLSPGLPVGGDVQLYALQFEIALNDRLSIVATKDGYADVNPDGPVLSEQEGFANLGAGVKYLFHKDPASGTALSATLTLELPTGDEEVFQGEGDGLANLIVSGLKLHDDWQFAGAVGLQAPFGDEQAFQGWLSAHASYEIHPLFIPLVELNWFHVIDPGDGIGNFPSQAGGVVPAVVPFEGGDLFNIGAVGADGNRDLVTAAVGFRSRLCDCVDLGVAYEFPLTSKEDSLIEDRLTIDLVWTF